MTTVSPNKTASFQKLFFTGVAGWILGAIALFAASWVLTKSESLSEALMWSVSFWWIAFAFGLVALVARGVLAKEALGSPVLAYLLPPVVITGVAGICLAFYPDEGFRSDLVGYLPVVVVFYVFGLLWMRVCKTDQFAFVRAVLPPLIGGLMILAFVAVPVFNSNAFRYRNAFGFTVLKSTNSDGAGVAEAVLEIRKPGHYQFTVPHFDIYDFGMEPAAEAGKITWGAAGEPKEGTTGSFPLIIRWQKTNPSPEIPRMPEMLNSAILEVRDAGAPETVIYTVVSQLPGDAK